MNWARRALVAMGMAAITSTSLATEVSVNAMDTRVLPVFVQVNSQGEITRMLPAEPLAPKYNRALEDTIQRWIKKPAIVNGRAVNSSMIMRVALDVQPRNDGKYDLVYKYISAIPTPSASASSYWRWTNNHLALVTEPTLQDQHWRDMRSGTGAPNGYPTRFNPIGPVAPARSNSNNRSMGAPSPHGH